MVSSWSNGVGSYLKETQHRLQLKGPGSFSDVHLGTGERLSTVATQVRILAVRSRVSTCCIDQAGEKHFQNGGVRTSKKSFLHKNKNSGKNCQNSFFRTLEINQRLVTIQEAFIQEK